MKIYNSFKWIAPVVFISLLLAVGCSKSAMDTKLQGRWSRVPVENLSTTTTEDWEFLGGSEFRIHYAPAGTGDTNFLVGKYTLESYREFSISGTDEGFPLHYIGKWRVIKNNKKVLILTKQEDPGGLSFREFTKI